MNYLFIIQDKNKIGLLRDDNNKYLIPQLKLEISTNKTELEKIVQQLFDLYILVAKITSLNSNTKMVHTEIHSQMPHTPIHFKWFTIKQASEEILLDKEDSNEVRNYLQKNIRVSNVKLQYGLKENKILHISQISSENRGEKCGCICPLCKQKLQARLGTGKRAPHYAHSVKECDIDYASETALHMLAKEILAEHRYIKLPSHEITTYEEDIFIDYSLGFEGRDEQSEPYLCLKETNFTFDHAQLEKRMENIIPDVLIWREGFEDRKLIIEIAVTHFIDKEKEEKIKQMKAPCIEIDLSQYHLEIFDRDILKQKLLDEVENKKWIYNRHIVEGIKIVNERNKKISEKMQKKREKAEKERLKKEQTKQQREEIKIKNIQFYLEEPNYKKLVTDLRHDAAVFSHFTTKNFYHQAQKEFPFYLDLPVTGQIAFNCDRRIWQMDLFEKFIFKRKNDSDISIVRIWKWMTEHNKIKHVNWDLVHKQLIQIDEMVYDKNLAYDAVVKYLDYLSLLGFIDKNGPFKYRQDYSIINRTIYPPNAEFSEHFKKIIATTDDTPSVDSDIYKKLY